MEFQTASYTTEPYFAPLSAGTYTLYLIDSFACMHTEIVDITSPPPIIVQLPADTSIQLGELLELPATANFPDSISYAWMPGDALSCDDCSEPIATPAFTTLYILTVIHSEGCTATD